ncbi:2-succinyl-5-enolpyruvyl-6-hydroxy-3-cyclohexene-1-carboxylic-acid synthase [Thermophagus sp. OGC60D27]|uniref:2-succinyl-5-enolpyruvyl-6-hydroxy-3- cyclohexene-1-carboxylic-acid synthase n=1 Tax=Thermophagus sp. OGC60D27 TaxID=3458415 RepID=UPI004037A3E6
MSLSISDKPVVRSIIEQCYGHGVRYVVISPGSRNAPLILSFPASKKFHCLSIVDERSAAYFALGLARKTNTPVALICTSGTAVLNYGPALAEAYYRQIPLIAITADRPPEYIDQADGQTIRQQNVFSNFVRYQCHLPLGELAQDDFWLTNRLLNEAFQNALGDVRGPVHINVPFREPLYGRSEMVEAYPSRIISVKKNDVVDNTMVNDLVAEISGSRKIMFLVGATDGGEKLVSVASSLIKKGVVVVTETLSNLGLEGAFGNTDRLLEYFATRMDAFRPDLLITLDVPVLSKRLKQFLRSCQPKSHWHFSNQSIVIDTYHCLTRQINGDAEKILEKVAEKIGAFPFDYYHIWEEAHRQTSEKHNVFSREVPWCDFKVFDRLSKAVPAGTEIHLGNSTPVRYAQLFVWKENQTFRANRGTSGIDGCVSTAAGAAYGGEQPVTLIIGDLAFLYDSNGLWHKYLPSTFRVIVINNGGGGIFRYIPGPSKTDELESFFEVRENHQCRGIAETFGLQYYKAEDSEQLDEILKHFWDDKERPALLEIFTPGPQNGEILRGYFSRLRGA